MKSLLLITLCIVSRLLFGQGEPRDQGTIDRIFLRNDQGGVSVRYTMPQFTAVPGETEGYRYIHVGDAGKLREPGKPALPALTELVAIPFHAVANLKITEAAWTDFAGFRIHPALQPAYDTWGASSPAFELDSALYQTDAFFPESPVEVVDTVMIRGIRVALIRIMPIQYNPVQGIIRVHRVLTMHLGFEGPNATFEPVGLENSAHFTRYLSGLLLNGAVLPEGVNSFSAAYNADYLIVTVDQFKSAADTLAKWRNQLGYRTEVISKPTWTLQQVTDSVHLRYQQTLPRPDYLLIIGDFAHVPAQTFTSGTTFYPTDLYFVCMDGSVDYFPDMAKGRISVANSSQAMAVVQKIVNYERNPVNDSAFFQNALHCAYFQDDDTSGYATRRFTHTSEEVRDYMLGFGYQLQRVYHTESYVNPTNYNNGFYSNGEPLPADLLRINGFLWNGGQTQIAQAINAGKFYVLHRDHGYVGGSGWASPYFTTTSLNNLSNGNKTPIVFSMNCHTGEFSLNECFAEKFLRLSAGGAAGVVAASFASYSGYNDALTVGMFDGIWNNPGLLPIFGTGGVNNPSVSPHPSILTMGDVLNHGLLRMVQTWNGSTSANTYQHRLFHYFGDPATKIFTQVPDQIIASAPDSVMVGTTHIPVTGCNVQDALATIVWQHQLVASASTANGQAFLNCAPLSDTSFRALLTISKHNHRPFVKEIVVVQMAMAPNNLPCDALPVPVKRWCDPISAGFAGADTSAAPYPGCAAMHGKDLWFSFQVPSSGAVEVELDDHNALLGVAAYSTGCNTPLFLKCDTTVHPSGRILMPVDSLIPGDTILLRVWQNGPAAPLHFTICVREPDSLPGTQIPYYTGFETGIDPCWQMISSNTVGRIRIDSICDARVGNASLLMDQNLNGSYARNEAWLRLDLRDQHNVMLKFWWREYGDEGNAEDGVFFSDDAGEHFVKVVELKGAFEGWTQYMISVDHYAALYGLNLTESFVVKFQQYDNWGMICSNPTGGDGFAFDEIFVFEDTLAPVFAAVPYSNGFENGFDHSWMLNTSHPLGRIVTTAAYPPPAGGNYFMMMDVSTGSNYNHNTADLHLNLNGLNNLMLSFAGRSFGNENHPENGIWCSDDGGASFVKVLSITDTNTYWLQKHLNLSAILQSNGLTPSQQFVIRFSQYDNSPVTSDGLGFDEISVQQQLLPVIDLWPIALGYSVDTGQTGTKSFHLINSGGSILTIDSLSLPYGFGSAQSFPQTIPAGDSLSVGIAFAPDSVGSFKGVAYVHHNGIQGLDSLRLSGLGMYRELVPSMNMLMFDTLAINGSDTIEFQLTNPGNGSIAMSAVTAPPGYQILTPQSQNFSIGQSRPVRVRFAPNAPGLYQGVISITSNANQLVIPVTGFAVDPLGVMETEPDQLFRVFPNPARDLVHIIIPEGVRFEFVLLDMEGRNLFRTVATESFVIDLMPYASGVYILEMRNPDLVQRTRIVKQ